jgi:hypothetical protein
VLQRAFRQRVDQRPDPVREPAHDRVRERDRPLEARASDELDRLVHRGVRRNPLGVRELVCAEAERRAHRRVELPHGSPPELLDRMVERPHALNRPVREPLCECPLPPVERLRRGAERAVGVRVLLEHAQHDLVGGLPRSHLRPRRNSS